MSPVAGTAGAIVLFSFSNLFSPFLAPESREAQQAMGSYRSEDWVGAIDHLERAIEHEPDPVLNYNLGAAAYKGQNYPAALEAYRRAARSEKIGTGRVAYDLGNARYRADDLQGALEAYRSALRANPDDENARYNYELTLRKLESGEQSENQQQQQQQQEGDQGGDRDEQSASSPDSTSQSQPQSGDESSDSGQQPEPTPGQKDEGDQNPSGSPETKDESAPEEAGNAQPTDKKDMLTSEDAVRLLNAVTPAERELIKARLKSSRRKKVEKDW